MLRRPMAMPACTQSRFTEGPGAGRVLGSRSQVQRGCHIPEQMRSVTYRAGWCPCSMKQWVSSFTQISKGSKAVFGAAGWLNVLVQSSSHPVIQSSFQQKLPHKSGLGHPPT